MNGDHVDHGVEMPALARKVLSISLGEFNAAGFSALGSGDHRRREIDAQSLSAACAQLCGQQTRAASHIEDALVRFVEMTENGAVKGAIGVVREIPNMRPPI